MIPWVRFGPFQYGYGSAPGMGIEPIKAQNNQRIVNFRIHIENTAGWVRATRVRFRSPAAEPLPSAASPISVKLTPCSNSELMGVKGSPLGEKHKFQELAKIYALPRKDAVPMVVDQIETGKTSE